jgi:hypothetical protein
MLWTFIASLKHVIDSDDSLPFLDLNFAGVLYETKCPVIKRKKETY